jgi:alcohol dehydrogenase
MKAYTINRYSKLDQLELVELSEPVIKDNEVLIRIHSAGLNQLDAKIKSGEFKLLLPYKFPLVLGHDLAGVVIKVGASCNIFKVGDEVYARPADFSIGAFADCIALNENDVALKPKNLSMDEAASLPLVALTVWQALVERAELKKGQMIFIQAGSGGVGTLAIQLAKHLGATVATTTSKDNFELVKRLGADVVIDYKTQDFATILKEYDVVLNSQDEKTLKKSISILKAGGKVISISGPPDPRFATELSLPWFLKMVFYFLSYSVRKLARRKGVDYSFLFMKANGQQLESLRQLIEAGVIQPVLDKVYAFDQVNEALNYVASGRARGKVVVKVL